jgi:hypothetical protein
MAGDSLPEKSSTGEDFMPKKPLDDLIRLFRQQCERARDRNRAARIFIVTPEQAAVRDRGEELVCAIDQAITSIIRDRNRAHECFICEATFDASHLPHTFVVAVPEGVFLKPGEKLTMLTYCACAQCARTEDLTAVTQARLWPTTAPRQH